MQDYCTVAIVDENPMFRKALAALVNSFPGYRTVFDAGSCEEGRQIIGSGLLPQILLLDIRTSGAFEGEGVSWLAQIFPEMKILALAEVNCPLAILWMIQGGARGCILKNGDPAELRRAFEALRSLGYFQNELVARNTLLGSGSSDMEGFSALSAREISFLRHACSEKTYEQIASEMFVAYRTVDGYRDSLFKKLGVGSRVGLVLYAIRNGVVRL